MPRTQRTGKKLYQIQPPLTVKGGVERVIDSAVGDIARTTSGWIEDEKYGWYLNNVSSAVSGEFDTEITRTGTKTLKLSATDATGRVIVGLFTLAQSTTTESIIKKYGIPVKPSTTYKINCYAKTTNAATGAVQIDGAVFTSTGTVIGGSGYATNSLSGTNDWTLLTVNITTGASASYISLRFRNAVAGNISDAWFDINSMTLEEVTTITNASGETAYLYPKVTAVTSTDNIDQSQVLETNTAPFGTNGANRKVAQLIVPTKKNITGFVIKRNTSTGTYVGDVTISLQATTSSLPNGTVIGTPVVIPNATWEAIPASTDYTITYPATLTPGTTYAIVFDSSTYNDANYANLKSSIVGPTATRNNGSIWSVYGTVSFYFKTLYSKNTTNFTVRTDTEELSVTAPTADGWEDGEVIDTFALGLTPITLAPGSNNLYLSSNGGDEADGEVDPSLQAIITPELYTAFERAQATNRTTASNRIAVRDMGTALRFDGVDDYVASPIGSFDVSVGQWTIAHWINSNTKDNRNVWRFVDDALANEGMRFNFEVNSRFGFVWNVDSVGTGGTGNKPAIPIPDGQPKLVGIIRNISGKYDIWIDKIKTLGSSTLNPRATSRFMFGRPGSSPFGGIADEIRIWNRELTDQEWYDMRNNNIIPQDSLKLEWLFDEGSGTEATDTSGNGNNGTITGATYTTDVAIIPREEV
jgi:hypothetical protein